MRRFHDEIREVIGGEIVRVLAAGFNMEVYHPKWLANQVLLLKKSDTWHMCIDYTDMNKACPNNPFALPMIYKVIDSTAGSELLCFLEAYSGYYHIKMKEENQEKT